MRSLAFKQRSHNRYWWYQLDDAHYVPSIYSALPEAEWLLMSDWFDDTQRKFPSPGELSVPGMSFLQGLISGSGIKSIVQCGHYVGYSTLMIGFLLRGMGCKSALFSIDIDPVVTEYTQSWVDKAKLADQVKLVVDSSCNPNLPLQARSYFGRSPQMIFIDSSHQYSHTLRELDLWYEALAAGGFLIMHDVSRFAQQFDATKEGGVLLAVSEWSTKRGLTPFLMNSFVDGSQRLNDLVYKDGCGMGVIQKPY